MKKYRGYSGLLMTLISYLLIKLTFWFQRGGKISEEISLRPHNGLNVEE